MAERNARCARLITFDADASSIEISFSAIYNWCKFTAWKGILSHNSPIDARRCSRGQLLSCYVFCSTAWSLSHSIYGSMHKHNARSHTIGQTYTTKKTRWYEGEKDWDGIHKKFLFWELKAHSPFQSRAAWIIHRFFDVQNKIWIAQSHSKSQSLQKTIGNALFYCLSVRLKIYDTDAVRNLITSVNWKCIGALIVYLCERFDTIPAATRRSFGNRRLKNVEGVRALFCAAMMMESALFPSQIKRVSPRAAAAQQLSKGGRYLISACVL